MLREKWSNILQLCRIDEWVANALETVKRKGKSLKKTATPASAEFTPPILYVRFKQRRVDKRVSFVPLHPRNRGHLALISDNLLGENYNLPSGHRYQPVDGPLSRRGVFMPLWKCKCQLLFHYNVLYVMLFLNSFFPDPPGR